MKFKMFVFTLFLSIYVFSGNVGAYDVTNYRLPTWEYPDKYYLNIDLRSPDADRLKASARIDINITEKNHNELVLNVDPLYINVDSANITVDAETFICSKVDYSYETQIMILTCEYDMWGNNTNFAQFEMHYSTKFSDTADGLSKYAYEINGTTKFIIFSQFETTFFRRVFPSFDEPCFKAPIRLNVDHYANLTVVSNMPETKSSDALGIHTSFDVTPAMASFTFALVAGDSSDWQHILIPDTDNIYIFMQQIHDDYVSVTKEKAPKLLKTMGEWTGIPYKELGIPKMTFAAIPGMGGAMENWGLITFSEGGLIDEANRTTSKQLIDMLTTMAHEIAHQWFGNYVTSNWWSEIWLAEGFANYFECYLADTLSTDDIDYEFDKQFVMGSFQYALKADGPTAMPLSNNDSNVNTPTEINETFGTIAYGKGASIIRMLRYVLGEEVFQKGLKEYLQAMALDNAHGLDLLKHLQAALPNDTDIDLPTYMASWIYQPNYPVAKTSLIQLSVDLYFINVTFYKYSLDGTNHDDSIWYTPVSVITSQNPDPDNATYTWVGPGTGTYGFFIPTVDDSWAIVNAGARGYYRVDYDLETLGKIIHVLNNSNTYADVATENRAQLLADLFNIAKINSVKGGYEGTYENAFKLAEYLKYETEYFPWYTFLIDFGDLLYTIQNETTITVLKKVVLALVDAQLVIPDSDNTPKLSHREILKRNLLLEWACKLNHADALAYVKRQYTKFLIDTQSIDSNYRDVVICYGIKSSDDPMADYTTLMDLYSKSILPFEKYDITSGAACAPQGDLLKNYLASTLRAVSPIDKQYWPGIFKTMSSRSSQGLDAALHFVVNHFDEISRKWKGVMDIERLISAISSKIVKPEQIKMLQNLLLENPASPSVIKAVEDAIKKVEFNFEWRDKAVMEITSFLRAK